jgi:TolB protein
MNRKNPGSATSDSDIFILNVDEFLKGKTKPRNLTNDPTTVDEDADWSPDGKTIAFTRYGVNESHENTTSTEIFLIDAQGKEKPRRLTNNSEEERSPAWSPDGKRIAFMCKAGGSEFQACVMNADGSGFRALTTKTGRTVVWSPDGQRIIFHRTVKLGEAEDEQIFSVDLVGQDEKQLTSGSALSGWANPGMVRRKLK